MKYDQNTAAVILSVGELCAYALQPGDLEMGGKRTTAARALLGAEAHRRIQADAGAHYHAEVPMCLTLLYNGIHYQISGRADGIIEGEEPTVDEIKTVSPRAFSAPPQERHLAQLKCYAYFLCRQRNLEGVQTRLTYYCTADGQLRHLYQSYSKEELEAYLLELLSRVEYRAQILCERETQLRPSAAGAHFPYASVRDGQDIMIRECYRDMKAGKRLFLGAPTGTGKTLSALYPAVRLLGEGRIDRIFYLTAKATTRREAYRAAGQLFESGAHLRTIVLTAREQLCRNDAAKADPGGLSRHCNGGSCPYAKGFFDRCGAAVCQALTARSGFDREAILRFAQQHHICPYEFQLELSEQCDILICDYNYAFDPQIYLRRYFGSDPLPGKNVFLIDEAHNLFDRASEMYSAELRITEVEAVRSRLSMTEKKLFAALDKLENAMFGFRRLCSDSMQKDGEGVEYGFYLNRRGLENVYPLVTAARAAGEELLKDPPEGLELPEVQGLIRALSRFEKISEYYDERFLTFITVEGEELSWRLICLDPSYILDTCHNRAFSSVLFSATLTPTDYFADILGGGREAVKVTLPSPFDPKNCCVAAVTGISTRYADRDATVKKLVSIIAATASGHAGNYMVFFPSYAYMEKTHKLFTERYPRVSTVAETRGMGHREREAFLSAFQEDGKLRVGFCVLGGSFSEGVDLPGGRLIGVVVVGTGLPGISNQRNILKEYYDNTRESGFEYAYTYPGINRVLQAAGRVIRRDDDRGVIVLVDDRYAEPATKMLLPDHWQEMRYARNANELAEIVTDFWA